MTERYRDLWTAVLQQAIDDLHNEPYGSLGFIAALQLVGSGS